MGYRLNRLDEPVFMAGPKPMRTEFGIHQRLESCGDHKGFFPCCNFYEGFMSGGIIAGTVLCLFYSMEFLSSGVLCS